MRSKAPLQLSDGTVINRREDRVHVDPEHKETVALEVAQAIKEITWKYADEEDKGKRLCNGCTMITLTLTFLELFKEEHNLAQIAAEMAETFQMVADDISRFGASGLQGMLLDNLRKVKKAA